MHRCANFITATRPITALDGISFRSLVSTINELRLIIARVDNRVLCDFESSD